MNDAARERIAPYLEEGERLLWAGKPEDTNAGPARWDLFWGGLALIVLAGAACATFVYVELTAAELPPGFGFFRALPLFMCVPYLVVGLYLLLMHRIMAATRGDGVMCGVTERAILLVRPRAIGEARVQRLSLRHLRRIGIKGLEGGFVDAELQIAAKRPRTARGEPRRADPVRAEIAAMETVAMAPAVALPITPPGAPAAPPQETSKVSRPRKNVTRVRRVRRVRNGGRAAFRDAGRRFRP